MHGLNDINTECNQVIFTVFLKLLFWLTILEFLDVLNCVLFKPLNTVDVESSPDGKQFYETENRKWKFELY